MNEEQVVNSAALQIASSFDQEAAAALLARQVLFR